MSIEIRQLTRKLEELTALVQSIPTNPESASSFASAQKVTLLEEKALDLENKYTACKKFLDEALEKIGLLEKKLLDVESKQGCMCAKIDKLTIVSESSSEDEGKQVDLSVAENPVYDSQPEEPVVVEEATEAEEAEEAEEDA